MKTPDLYELEYLFECDAIIVDKEIPWYYAGASFSLIKERRLIEFKITPAVRDGKLKLQIDEEVIIDLKLENIKEIQIYNEKNIEGLNVFFDVDNYVLPLQIQTKPVIKIEWGTSIELQR